jgi:D-glycero-D-manno-heptose 1,7-bisphosphate phosphatase
MKRAAAFLDRDGTIIEERNFISRPEDVVLLPGAADALGALRRLGYALVLVTNQSGIARGLFGEPEFRAVQQRLAELLAAEGVTLDGVYWCPHHPDFSGPCACRKPGLLLFRQAVAEFDLDAGACLFVGDRARDVVPALELGGRGFLVRTGYGATEAVPVGVETIADLQELVRRISG